jgi:hypothetical protein
VNRRGSCDPWGSSSERKKWPPHTPRRRFINIASNYISLKDLASVLRQAERAVITAVPVCPLMLFTTLTKVGLTPVTHVSAEAEDNSAAFSGRHPSDHDGLRRARHRFTILNFRFCTKAVASLALARRACRDGLSPVELFRVNGFAISRRSAAVHRIYTRRLAPRV